MAFSNTRTLTYRQGILISTREQSISRRVATTREKLLYICYMETTSKRGEVKRGATAAHNLQRERLKSDAVRWLYNACELEIIYCENGIVLVDFSFLFCECGSYNTRN